MCRKSVILNKIVKKIKKEKSDFQNTSKNVHIKNL
jgi:hypothetical protein